MGKTFSLYTLGCKVNQYNSWYIRENLLSSGWEEKEEGKYAIINGCSVTQVAERKTRKLIYRATRENKMVILTGCFARSLSTPEEGFLVFPQEERVIEFLLGRKPPHKTLTSFKGRARALVKIQEGCLNFCSYCIVPFLRGRFYSRPMEEILEEVRNLSCTHSEIVLTGTHLGQYGNDLHPPLKFPTLVSRILETIPTGVRLRLSSIEVTEITPPLLDLFSHPQLCPHLHIPLQSGDREILRKMNRPYTPDFFLRKVEEIRERFPDIALTTDVMVGFPGEKEEHFSHTLKLVEEIGFPRIHIFPYSPRPLTPAASLPGEVPERTKKERENILRELAIRISHRYRRKFLGKIKVVVVEYKKRKGFYGGYTENYIWVQLKKTPPSSRGKIQKVKIVEVKEHFTRGVLVEQ